MGALLEQFLEACQTWQAKTTGTDGTVALHVMYHLGHGGTYGRWNLPELSHVRQRIEQLRDRDGLTEYFLVLGVIRLMEDHLEQLSEGYAKSIDTRRYIADHFSRLATDETYRAEFNRTQKSSITAAEAAQWANDEQLRSVPSLDEQKRLRKNLDAWRQVTEAILDPTNLKHALADEHESRAARS